MPNDPLLLRIQLRKLALLGMAHKQAKQDVNHLTDVYENQGMTPMPYPPAEVSPIGMLDGIYPLADFEGSPLGSLYYGTLQESNMAEDGEIESAEESKDSKDQPKKPAKTTPANKTAYRR